MSETDKFLSLAVRRSGGGYANTSINYFVNHFTTNDSDVTATAPYTTVQRLDFPDGVTERVFKISILDDNIVEEDEVVQIVLEVPQGGGSIGAQFRTNITIVDDDSTKLSAKLSWALQNFTQVVANSTFSVTVQSVTATGNAMTMGNEKFFAVVENDADQWRTPGTATGAVVCCSML